MCDDMSRNRGYKLYDLCCYLNQFEEVQVAAVWHFTDANLERIEMPLKCNSIQTLIYSKLMVPFQIPGVCLVFTKNNKVVIDEAFGFANVRLKIKASTDNLHRIASVSKVFTYAAIT